MYLQFFLSSKEHLDSNLGLELMYLGVKLRFPRLTDTSHRQGGRILQDCYPIVSSKRIKWEKRYKQRRPYFTFKSEDWMSFRLDEKTPPPRTDLFSKVYDFGLQSGVEWRATRFKFFSIKRRRRGGTWIVIFFVWTPWFGFSIGIYVTLRPRVSKRGPVCILVVMIWATVLVGHGEGSQLIKILC